MNKNKNNDIEGRMGPIGEATGYVVRHEQTQVDNDSWTLHTVLAVHGELPRFPEEPAIWNDEVILQAVARFIPIASVGNNGPGRPFAEEPWLQVLGGGRTLIVSQRGGLDV